MFLSVEKRSVMCWQTELHHWINWPEDDLFYTQSITITKEAL